jgi:hypothetical protein
MPYHMIVLVGLRSILRGRSSFFYKDDSVPFNEIRRKDYRVLGIKIARSK